MKILLLLLLHDAISVFVLWILYLATMHLKVENDKQEITGFSKPLGRSVYYIGYVLDVYVNVIVMSRYFLEFPMEMLVTSRLTRHSIDGDGYRKKLADWMCLTLLNRFDPSGCHCKK